MRKCQKTAINKINSKAAKLDKYTLLYIRFHMQYTSRQTIYRQFFTLYMFLYMITSWLFPKKLLILHNKSLKGFST